MVTIPASFDETARELTLAAAREAGLQHLTLLEEPLAAFYAWLHRHGPAWRERLRPGERVLVVDVGGGTTDFSFIEVDEQGALHRLAVGEHLLLGGDNIDMAIARELEQRWQTRLNPGDWAMLCQRARQAKEQILEDGREQAELTLLAKGSSVLANVRRATLTRAELVRLLETGFYPLPPADTAPPRKAHGIRQMGLPYAAEPAVTVHLLHFLRYAWRVHCRLQQTPETPGLLYPDRVLFNGGSMRAVLARERVLAAIAAWFPDRPPPTELPGEDYSLAVAIGAAYYGQVRRGQGVKVRGGIARAYFLPAADQTGTPRQVCVMARDTDESVPVRVPGLYRLQTNEKVLFHLSSSATRLHDRPGDVLDNADDLTPVAPLVTVLRYGKGEQRAVEVQLETQLSAVGTLELVLAATGSDHRWPLRFDLRGMADQVGPAAPAIVVDAARLAAARALVERAFGPAPDLLRTLFAELEAALDLPREEWSLPVLRELADACLALAEERRRTPAHELRWLNLAGFALRPGFGEAADPLRLREVWKLWFGGPAHPRQPQNVAEWWVFWRRVAPGLKSGHQVAMGDTLEKLLAPKGIYQSHVRDGAQSRQEMWRCLGALEQLPVKRKQALGQLLAERLAKLPPEELWVLARLGARHLVHAPSNLVVPPAAVAEWVERLLALPPRPATARPRLFAISLLAALTGDRALDLPAELQTRCQQHLAEHEAPAAWCQRLAQPVSETREAQAQILGDSVPLGLTIVDAPA